MELFSMHQVGPHPTNSRTGGGHRNGAATCSSNIEIPMTSSKPGHHDIMIGVGSVLLAKNLFGRCTCTFHP